MVTSQAQCGAMYHTCMKGKCQPHPVMGNNCGVRGQRWRVLHKVLWICTWSLVQITLCRTWRSRLYHLYAPHARVRLLYRQSLNGRCTCNNAVFWERRPLSLESFPPIEALTLGLDYTTQLGTEVEFWWADRGDRGRMFTAHFHIHWLEAIEKCFTVSTEHTGLKGWEMCHQVMNLEYQASQLQPLL